MVDMNVYRFIQIKRKFTPHCKSMVDKKMQERVSVS